MTIHFHSEHFKGKGLSLNEYFLLLLHEDNQLIKAEEISKTLNINVHMVRILRTKMVKKEYLKRRGIKYTLTDKLYS